MLIRLTAPLKALALVRVIDPLAALKVAVPLTVAIVLPAWLMLPATVVATLRLPVTAIVPSARLPL